MSELSWYKHCVYSILFETNFLVILREKYLFLKLFFHLKHINCNINHGHVTIELCLPRINTNFLAPWGHLHK